MRRRRKQKQHPFVTFLPLLAFLAVLSLSSPRRRHNNAAVLAFVVPAAVQPARDAWKQSSQQTPRIPLSGIFMALQEEEDANDDNGDDDDEQPMDEEERMRLVRSLQKTFYNSPSESSSSSSQASDNDNTSTTSRAALDTATGIVHNLPLWRVGWVEVPGRTNCLNVHEGQYTHMFETILNGPKPWYVGHLHLPGGFKMTRTGEPRYTLKSWQEEVQDKNRYRQPERSAVIGCLMQITDFRRMKDGRLCLLVQTLERFVVDQVVQEFPYSIANVQILLDQEEYPEGVIDENFAKITRGALVERSFQYHPYEFCPTELPLTKSVDYLESNSISKEAISKLLPFAMYSLDESLLKDISTEEIVSANSDGIGFAGASKPLEAQLEAWRILRDPPSSVAMMDTDDETNEAVRQVERKNTDLNGLETLLWLAIEDLVRQTGFCLPTEILALQPPHMDYLDLQPVSVTATDAGGPMDFVHLQDAVTKLSPQYPAYRRQKRLSYALPALLESSPLGANLRQAFLNTPSTKMRLANILERLETINASLAGKYQ